MGILTVCVSFTTLSVQGLPVDTLGRVWLLNACMTPLLGHLYTFLPPQQGVTLTAKAVLKLEICVVCVISACRAAPLQFCSYRSECSQILVNGLIGA